MDKTKLRLNSRGWWWVWGKFLMTGPFEIREIVVGPFGTPEDAYIAAASLKQKR